MIADDSVAIQGPTCCFR